MTDKPQALMTHEQFHVVVPDSEMGVTYRNLVVALEAYERDLTKRDEALRIAREALEESLSLNKNWTCEAEPETLAYYSEYKAVIRQAEEALAAIDALKE